VSFQQDLDQGGTFRQTQKLYLGPSVGWIEYADQWVQNVTTGGTTTLVRGTNIILVAFNGAVTLQLPSLKASAAGPQAIPRQFSSVPITICDIGGFALANPITVLPFAGETLSGLASVPLASNFGSLVIRPDIVNGGGQFLQ
jgi:hypothetical protein